MAHMMWIVKDVQLDGETLYRRVLLKGHVWCSAAVTH